MKTETNPNRIQHVSFVVYGVPQPAGSKRAFPIRKAGEFTGRVAVTDANPKSREWKNLVSDVAREAMKTAGLDSFLGAVELTCTFMLPRPKGHYKASNPSLLRDKAPAHCITKPDTLKLARAVEDACTGIVWRDDSQIVDETLHKRYVRDRGIQAPCVCVDVIQIGLPQNDGTDRQPR